MSLLNQLYHEWYEMNSPSFPEEHDVFARYEDAWKKAEKILDKELSNELLGCIIELMDAASSHDFEEGFRLGAQLMMELHPPYFANSTAKAPVKCPTPTL